MPKIPKKIHRAIYVMKHGQEHSEYAGFPNLPEKEIFARLRKLNTKSVTDILVRRRRSTSICFTY